MTYIDPLVFLHDYDRRLAEADRRIELLRRVAPQRLHTGRRHRLHLLRFVHA